MGRGDEWLCRYRLCDVAFVDRLSKVDRQKVNYYWILYHAALRTLGAFLTSIDD